MAKIIIVEDNKNTTLFLKEELADAGHDPIAFNLSKYDKYQHTIKDVESDLIKEIRLSDPNIVILDLNLEIFDKKIKNKVSGEVLNMEGLDIIPNIRSNFIDLPIIIHTSYSQYRQHPNALTANYYVEKSYNLKNLKLNINRCLEHCAHTQYLEAGNVGYFVAERDLKLGYYFIESSHYKYAAEGDKYVLLGNRGTGKSAICKILSEREKTAGSIVIGLSPDEVSYELVKACLSEQGSSSWAKHSAYTAAWKHLIYILVMKEFAKCHKGLKTGPATRIHNYIRDNYKGLEINFIDTLISYLRRIEGFKIGKYEAGVKVKELSSLHKLDDIAPLIADLNELCSQRKVMLIVDELDRGWDGSEDSQNFVSGLFHAALSINSINTNLRILLSLRKELYNNIPNLNQDAEKHRDILDELTWDEDLLLELIGSRLKYSIPALNHLSSSSAWNKIFAPMPGGKSSYKYIINRTLYRPREIIQFCSLILDISRRKNIFPITLPAISEAEKIYSNQRLEDIASEYKFQYPGLLNIFTIFRGKNNIFAKEDMETILLSISLGDFQIDPSAKWALHQDPSYLIEVLWRVGFLTAQVESGSSASPQFVGIHQISHVNLFNVERFQIHPMFWSALDLVHN